MLIRLNKQCFRFKPRFKETVPEDEALLGLEHEEGPTNVTIIQGDIIVDESYFKAKRAR